MPFLTIALDVMGGDQGPPIVISAAIKTLRHFPQVNIILCGDASVINHTIKEVQTDLLSRITVLHCNHSIGMNDSVKTILRDKKQSSMRSAIDLVASGTAQACVSCGNTAGLFALASARIEPLPYITRPALISQLPSQKQTAVWLLDLGANIQSNTEVLVQNAVMGSVIAEAHLGRPAKVALLNVGEEENKGRLSIKKAAEQLKNMQSMHYIGFVEGNDIFTGKADVIVTDGFTGNVTLKTSEGLYQLIYTEIMRLNQHHWLNRLSFLILKPILKRLYNKMKPDQYNGASLVGLSGIVVKSHGNANTNACFNAIKLAIHEANVNLPNKIKHRITAKLQE